MITLIKIAGKDPIENVVTCMNFKIDRVFFFGYQEDIHFYRKSIIYFLKKKCSVSYVNFTLVSHTSITATARNILKVAEQEAMQGSEVFMDLTGGEGIVMMAAGLAAVRYDIPMHFYDIGARKLHELRFPHLGTKAGDNNSFKIAAAPHSKTEAQSLSGVSITLSYEASEIQGNNQEDPGELNKMVSTHGKVSLSLGKRKALSKTAQKQEVSLNIDSQIRLRGGVINYSMRKSVNKNDSSEFMEDVRKLWEISWKFREYWNPFSIFMKKYLMRADSLEASAKTTHLIMAINESETKLKNFTMLNQILTMLSDAGLLVDLERSGGTYSFRYKNKNIKSCIEDGGRALELHVYRCESLTADDCMVGVHLDWNGVISDRNDVLNEIDVISIKNNIPTFISCKSGRMASGQVLHALYELQTVAERFGGKYAKKALACVQPVSRVYRERAREMGIELYDLEGSGGEYSHYIE